MARTSPLPSGTGNGNGCPWGARSEDTGTPLTGVAQDSSLTISGTPHAAVQEDQHWTVRGTPEAGDVATLILDGTPYAYTVLPGDDDTAVAAGVTALAAADPNYYVTNAAAVVDVLAQIPGPWSGSISATYVPIGTGNGGWTGAIVTPGANANVARVQDNLGHVYEYTVLGGDLNDDIAVGLAAAINGNNGYTASATGSVISVQNAIGVAFSFVDASINNTTPGTTITYALVGAGSAIVASGSPYLLQASRVQFGGLWCELVSGTGCTVVPWFWGGPANLFAAQTPVVITANKFIPLDLSAVDGLFIEQNTFAGGGVVKVTATGAPLGPGGM